MFQGDSLTVFLFLAGTALSAFIASIAAPSGAPRKALIGVGMAFVLATVGWVVAPSAGPIMSALRPLVVAVINSGAPVMVGTVAIVTTMLVRRDQAPPAHGVDLAHIEAPQLPKFAVHPSKRVKWTPDTSFEDAFMYFAKESGKRGYHDQPSTVLGKFLPELRAGKVTAWGKEHPEDTDEFQIKPSFWVSAEVTMKTNYVFSSNLDVGVFNVRLSRGELELVWPPKERA